MHGRIEGELESHREVTETYESANPPAILSTLSENDIEYIRSSVLKNV